MDRQPSGYEDVALGLLLVVAAVAGVLWAGGQASAWISGHRLPHREPLAGLAALAHLGDPSAAWHSPVGPPEIYWACMAAALAVAGFVAFAGWRLWRFDVGANKTASPVRAEGLAPRSEVRRAAGARALVARSKTLRPSLQRPRPAYVGYRLGTSRGVVCWASVEDSMLLLGPPRSGKGQSVVIPMILDAPGAVVTTSTRPDNLAITLAARASRGPVAVFDPQRLAQRATPLPALRWSLVRGCESPQMAIIRAEALVSETSRSGVESGTFWRQQALAATRCMLHAAALGGRSPSDLYRWSHSAPGAKEAVVDPHLAPWGDAGLGAGTRRDHRLGPAHAGLDLGDGREHFRAPRRSRGARCGEPGTQQGVRPGRVLGDARDLIPARYRERSFSHSHLGRRADRRRDRRRSTTRSELSRPTTGSPCRARAR